MSSSYIAWMFTTEILLDNPGDLCTSHDKQRKICRTWFVEYCLTSAPVSLEMLFLFEHYGCLGYGCCRVEYRNHNCSSFPLESGLLSGFEKIPLPTPSPTPQTGHVKCIHLILDNSYTGYLVGEPWGKVHQPVTGQGRGGEGSIFFSFHGQKKVMVFPSYVKHNT